MKAFTNANPRDLQQAVTLAAAGARATASTAAIAGGGSDLLGHGEGAHRHARRARQPESDQGPRPGDARPAAA